MVQKHNLPWTLKWHRLHLGRRLIVFFQIRWLKPKAGGLRGWCPPASLHLSVLWSNQSSPPGICCRVSVGVSRLRQELRRCAVVWKLRRGAHLLLPGVSADIKRSAPPNICVINGSKRADNCVCVGPSLHVSVTDAEGDSRVSPLCLSQPPPTLLKPLLILYPHVLLEPY